MTIIRDRECWITADAQLWQTEDEIGLWMPDTPITSYISFVVESRDNYFEIFPRQ